jgi:hypothetical protein
MIEIDFNVLINVFSTVTNDQIFFVNIETNLALKPNLFVFRRQLFQSAIIGITGRKQS